VPHFLHRVGPLPFHGGWTSRANDLGRRERAPEGSHNLKHKKRRHVEKTFGKAFVEGWWKKARNRESERERNYDVSLEDLKLQNFICGAPRLPQTPTTVISQQTVTHKPSIQTNQTSIKKTRTGQLKRFIELILQQITN